MTFEKKPEPILTYEISKGLLKAGEKNHYSASPHVGKVIKPVFIIVHYTAGRSLENAVASFKDADRKASAHFIIGKGGHIVQMVNTNRAAFHAGVSSYKHVNDRYIVMDYTSLNGFSIGIEFVNAGRLLKAESARYKTWWGEDVEDDDVIITEDYHIPSKYQGQAVHKVGVPFERYTPEQLEAGLALCRAIKVAHPIIDIIGHSDVAIPEGRKIDPGPAFPIANFRAALFGRQEAGADENDETETQA
jgi:N-acetylmuramoyl-L-alanine amidase